MTSAHRATQTAVSARQCLQFFPDGAQPSGPLIVAALLSLLRKAERLTRQVAERQVDTA